MKSLLRRLLARKRLLIVALVVVGLGFLFFRSRGNGEEHKEATALKGEVREELVLSGQVEAVESANLQFNISGTLAWVGAGAGETVKKGQALMKLDTVKLNTTYQSARETLRAAEANLEEIYDEVKGNDSDETFEQKNTRTAAEATKNKAYEAVISAQKDLKDATLIAPFGGVVSAVTNEAPGVNITAGVSQITLVNPKTIYFSVNADQTEVSMFEIGETAEITLDAFEDEVVGGTISAISVAPDPSENGTVYPIRIALDVDNQNYKYKIGMTGDSTFILSKKSDALFVPSDAVRNDREGSYVLINGGKEKRYIETGIEGGDKVEIVNGISEGEKVYY